ncbi:hypothetical protein ACMAUO_12805 [Gluconacetobacter sp. Hr-1-5]|uniref:hypothetical protein n=1 Tax=Gluconacetobacter sp. Hr-1-5 TaxID=3395370 RepID=UPI003B52E9CF
MMPWRCWHELSGSRGSSTEGFGAGMGKIRIVAQPSAIPVNEIDAWCRNHGLQPSHTAFTRHLVLAMDRRFLAIRAQQIKSGVDAFFA